MFCEGFFSFSFTHNALVHSGLRGAGEEVKAKNENLLTCRCVRAYAYAHSARGCARSCDNWGREMEKWGGKRKKVGEGVKRVGEHELKMW